MDEELGNTHESANSSTLHWLSSHWLMLVMVIVGGVLVLGVVRFISQMFNGDGPIQKGIGDALGAAANFVNGITNGCSSQADCSKATSEDPCNKSQGCSWNESKSGDTKSSCINVTGNSPGNKSFFSTSCVLGMGFIAYIAGSIVLALGGWMLNRNKNKNLETANRLSNTDSETGLRDTTESARKKAGRAREILEAENGAPLEANRSRDLGRLSGITEARDRAVDAINGQDHLSAEEKAQQCADAYERFADYAKEAQEAATENGVDEGKHDEDTKAVDEVENLPDIKPPVEVYKSYPEYANEVAESYRQNCAEYVPTTEKGKDIVSHVNNVFHTFINYNIPMSRNVFEVYNKKVQNNAVPIHSSLQAGYYHYKNKYSA